MKPINRLEDTELARKYYGKPYQERESFVHTVQIRSLLSLFSSSLFGNPLFVGREIPFLKKIQQRL